MRIAANGLELEVESMGKGEPLLLIMGLGAQLVHWPDGLCEQLVARGFRVIRFDNRDVGLSEKMKGRVADVRLLYARRLLGLPVDAPYRLIDMADDTAALLDALGLESAHVAGVSMGGMIAQTLAIAHPHRVRSLASIMSTPGSRMGLLSRPTAALTLISPMPREREAMIQHEIEVFQTIGGRRAHAPDKASLREISDKAFARCVYPAGFIRQLAAILASPDRRGALAYVRVPTTVIHGSADPLILPIAGRATAAAIPGAHLRIIEDMGHDLPPSVWPLLAAEIEGLAARARARVPAQSKLRLVH